MPTVSQLKFLEQNRHLIKEPILIVGAKTYDYDKTDFTNWLKVNGFNQLIGIDLDSGKNVDFQVDLCDRNSLFYRDYESYFNTIICMSVFMYVPNPFTAASNISKISKSGAILFFCEPIVHKTTNMPVDYWRMAPAAHKVLFEDFTFDESSFYSGITRSDHLSKFKAIPELRQDKRYPDESALGFLLRKTHSKFFSRGLFRINRLLPESLIFSISKKN